jgi:serine/threonine protein phosphatase PrpC
MSNMISITSASATDKGAYTYNQDRAYVGFVEPHETCAVFDGHGTHGEEIAMWCVEMLAAADKEGKTLDFAEVQTALRERLRTHVASKSLTGLNVYEQQEGLYHVSGLPVRGGTTASVLRIDRTTGAIECASVGDSEVRYYDEAGDGTTLCGDHSPTNPEEYARVLAFAAEKGRPAARFAYDTQNGTLSREDRCPFIRNEEGTAWVPNPAGGFFHCDVRENYGAYIYAPNGEGLAMTRALGDFNISRYGVSQEAHVVTAAPPALTEDTQIRAVVWASDGLWDLLPYADVGAVVRREDLLGNAEAAAAALLELAKERTRAAFGGALGDNITVGVSYIVYPRVPIVDTERAGLEHAIRRFGALGYLRCAHSDRPGEREESEREMVGKPPGTAVLYSARRSTRRYLYRRLEDGSYWEVVYFGGEATGAIPWLLEEDSPLRAAPAPVDPVTDRLMGRLRAVATAAPAPEPPAALDLAFLLSGSPIKRESLFTGLGLDDISVIEPADETDALLWGPTVKVVDMDLSLPTEIMSCLSTPPALPGSTAAILHRADPTAPEAPRTQCGDRTSQLCWEDRWLRAGSPEERAAILESLPADHPLHCDLHRSQALPGPGLRRSRNSFRSYGSYAPPCSGCRIGAEEEIADAADDAELTVCTEWLNLRIADLADASVAGHSAAALADRRAEVEGGMIRLEICEAWSAFGDPAVMRAAEVALAADDAAADIRRAMTIIAEAKDILRTATGRLRATPQGAGYAAYKTAMAFLEANP